ACAGFGHDNLHDYGQIFAAPTAVDPGRQAAVCDRCGDVVVAVDVDAYETEVAYWQNAAAQYSNSDFAQSGSITQNLGKGTSFNYLDVNPTVGQHPRVLFNENDIPGIRTALENATDAAKTDYYVAVYGDPTWGELDPAEDRDNGFHNFSASMLSKLQMCALDYQLTGNKINGYMAIRALKEYLKRMDFQELTGDPCRTYGHIMYIAACVYDWCYDLMTSTDRSQIVFAVQKKCCDGSKMEVGFPPSGQNAVSGHGCEFQILRDYLSFAIAIYDEYPGWWNYIGYRFYNEFVPVRNEFYEAGMYPQGTSLYVRIRYTSDLYSAWLIKAMTGSIPYASAENMKQVARTIFSYEWRTQNGKTYGLASGDDQVTYGEFINYSRVAMISSYLFDDATMRAQFEYFKKGYSSFDTNFTVTNTVAEYLICSSSGLEAADDRHEDMDLIVYNGGWLGQIIARNDWSTHQALVLMKIGVRTTANHEHYDSGQFQIYYRSRLAVDSGVYYDYGNDHHYYYHQATVAHNSLLIYNSSLRYSDGGYYSGGQKRRSEPGSYSNWQTSTYKMGDVTGVEYAYADQAQTRPTYAYIAGNIAAAYDSSVASEVTRRMLAVYDTGLSNAPMFFFVFDNITAKSSSFQKTFLFHVASEPTIDGNRVSVANGSGKLVLQNVIGNNVTISPVGGGTGQNYIVNGSQLSAGDRNDGFWGRVEIKPATGNATDKLLNAMYVCDTDNDPNLTAQSISTSVVKGAVLGNTAAIFVTSATRRSTEFSFTAPGEGYLNYYVSGVADGTWLVEVGGKTVNYDVATSAGGFITFTAPAGSTVTLRQGEAPNTELNGNLGEGEWPEFEFGNIYP
ncbi:MAG: heparinase II/III family protein, partial [Clostridia bacterium]|nr:heparinase II/III family protein [Clostridia bacterium]